MIFFKLNNKMQLNAKRVGKIEKNLCGEVRNCKKAFSLRKKSPEKTLARKTWKSWWKSFFFFFFEENEQFKVSSAIWKLMSLKIIKTSQLQL